MSSRTQQAVKLHDLLSQPFRHSIDPVVLASGTRTVRGVALIADIDEISSIEPDTVAVLTDDVAQGGWMVSAALRYAWERNASALVFSARALNPSVIQLAERFKISLITSSEDITEVAIEISNNLGFARAQLISSLQQLNRRIDESEDIDTVLSLAAHWLRGSKVFLEAGGVVVRTAPTPEPTSEGTLLHRVAIPVGHGGAVEPLFIAEVPPPLRDRASAVLEICATKLRTLLAEAALQNIEQSLSPLSIATLTDSHQRFPKVIPRSKLPEWNGDSKYFVVCLLSEQAARYGAALHQTWLTNLRDCPLVTMDDGWLAFVSVGVHGERQTFDRVRIEMAELPLLGMKIGVSRTCVGGDQLMPAIQEAWLAARIAEAGPSGEIVSYASLPLAFLPRLLPHTIAKETLRLRFPQLERDPQRDELIELFTSYAARYGSATATAAHLGIHRNTVKQRLARLKELDVPVDDATETLGLQLLFAAVQRSHLP